ncbi:hypothetical protein [Paractinoplanes atraurantiacus]|uniref:Uncharacterized protein n=1 Tax=Paractinoplanes atraurantiacus TaxID=1036182 RepID=A0A285HX89_9ACTN|nr:hypothetical protein [Actinoplanes atraurantiacus]SNY40348.1 hypothetical protein SAMN05421748_10624 [Actinoplanes atraurantiacus]
MPRSRGRGKSSGGKSIRVGHPVRDLTITEYMVQDALAFGDEDTILDVEEWASGWLGEAWRAAGEHQLCLDVVRHAAATPSEHALSAVAALRRMAPPEEWKLLDETIERLFESQPLPTWFGSPAFTPSRAYRSVDPYDSEHVLFIEYGLVPHVLMAEVYFTGIVWAERLTILEPNALEAWKRPLSEHPVEEILAELADAMRGTDDAPFQPGIEDYADLRALVWSRCRDHLPAPRERTEMDEAERAGILDEFETRDPIVRRLAELFLDFGDSYFTSGPLSWSPAWVQFFQVDWLPEEKVALEAEERAALPGALRRWVRFALERRGVAEKWIVPVVEIVSEP